MLPKQENLPLARQLAVQGLLKSDLAERAARCGGRFTPSSEGGGRIGFPYLGREVLLSFPQGTIRIQNGGSPIPLREEILILHYLEKSTGVSLTGKWISFTEVPGATFYHPVFLQRCKVPLVRYFGESLETLLWISAREVGGKPWPMGDVGVKIQAFPSVALGLALWRGDREFPSEGNVLLDSSIIGTLPVEDIVILAETVVWKIIKAGQR
jgi:hypothetical protein